MATVNLIQLRAEIDKQEATKIRPAVSTQLNKIFVDEKARFMEKFEEHPVTREIEEGASGTSDYVKTSHGGNLFSLLGFVEKVDPIAELRSYLQENISKGKVVKTSRRDKLVYTLETRIPTWEELKRKTQLLVWSQRSWVDLIEKGVQNFSNYLFDDSGRLSRVSRSGTAIEIDHDIPGKRGVRAYRPTAYMSKLLDDLRRRLSNK